MLKFQQTIKLNNNFIFINYSPWPIMTTMSIMNMATALIFSMSFKMSATNMIAAMMIFNSLNLWSFNSNMMKTINGYKNMFTNTSMKMLAMMFIMSETMFFSTFFYVMFSNKFFNIFFSKKYELSMFKLSMVMSMMNLIILLASSISFMIFIKNNLNNKKSNKFIMLTIILSIYFISVQIMEYKFMSFNLTNSIFFSVFYTLTMFHMSHVIMGTLMIVNITAMKLMFFNNMFVKMMFICWYWHFVDLIWVVIFFTVY